MGRVYSLVILKLLTLLDLIRQSADSTEEKLFNLRFR